MRLLRKEAEDSYKRDNHQHDIENPADTSEVDAPENSKQGKMIETKESENRQINLNNKELRDFCTAEIERVSALPIKLRPCLRRIYD